MRFGLFKPGLSRVVLDIAGPVKITKAFMVPRPLKAAPVFHGYFQKTDHQSVHDGLQAIRRTGRAATQTVAFPTPGPPQVRSSKKDTVVIMIDPGMGALTPAP